MNIQLKIINQIPDHIEKYIIKKINKKSPQMYGPISDYEINFIYSKLKSKFKSSWPKSEPKSEPNYKQIITSIKSSYIKDYMIKKHYRLNKYKSKLIKKYNQDKNILYLSQKYKISPMTILRMILESKYKKNIKEIYQIKNKIDQFDSTQLMIAINADIYNQIDQTELQTNSVLFENQIESILKKHNIKYQTQTELTTIQLKLYNKAISTPDFLIESDLIINGHKINWIDAKNFYGSNIPFVRKKIQKQISKYIDNYGSGCLIFNYGFNSSLKFDQVLILSVESIS